MRLFFELLQVALGHYSSLSTAPSEKEWKAIFYISQKQTVASVVFEALETLSNKGIKPPQALLFEWIGLSEQVRNQNRVVNQRCAEITKTFCDAGWKTCILKGQGNALMYPNPLCRMPGDVDIWVDASKDDVVDFVRRQFPDARVTEHHIEYHIFDDVEVEVHFRPVSAVSVSYDKRLDSYCFGQKDEQFQNRVNLPETEGGVNVPTVEFNVIYQMAHMMKHFFSEGLGMRHLMDYYFVMMSDEMQTGKDYTSVFQELGLLRFAKAVMWVLGNVFLLERNRMVCEPDERRGELLLQEIMAGGNFGHGDKRFAKRLITKSSTLSILIRNAKLFWQFPEEAIMAPVSNVIRRLKNG